MKFSKALLAVVFVGVSLGSQSATAQSNVVTDCPLRDMPFSIDSPIIDLLPNAAARTVLEEEFDIPIEDAPSQFFNATVPSFAAILTLNEARFFLGGDEAALARVDARLRKIPVTDHDRQQRCERYDDNVPQFDIPQDRPAILLFEKINGYRDAPSVEAAHEAFTDMAQQNGWTIVPTELGGAINAETLKQFDVVVWNNISGDVLTLSQRAALQDYVEGGGGFLAVHGSAGDAVYFWDWYVDTLIGARFQGHANDPQFQDATLKVEDTSHPVARRLPQQWVMNDEWYSFKTNPRSAGARIIATLDEATYDPTGHGGVDLRMGDHPIVWSNDIGKGRMLYSAIGHRPETYDNPNYRAILVDAIQWMIDSEDTP